MRNKLFCIVVLVSLVGCATAPPVIDPTIQKVMVPVSVPCKIEIPVKPIYNFDKITPSKTLYEKVQALLADRDLSKGYEGELEIALISCTK